MIPLEKKAWEQLEYLQEKYGNLSNESITVITSAEQIVSEGRYAAFGYDKQLFEFFQHMTLCDSYTLRMFPHVPGVNAFELGPVLDTYEVYLRNYTILRTPHSH